MHRVSKAMGQYEYDVLMSLSDQIPDEVLKKYFKPMLRDIYRSIKPALPPDGVKRYENQLRGKIKREEFFKLLTAPTVYHDDLFSQFLQFLHRELNIDVEYIPHAKFLHTRDEGYVSAEKIFDLFWSHQDDPDVKVTLPALKFEQKDRPPVYITGEDREYRASTYAVTRYIKDHAGGAFCKALNEIRGEKVLGTGTYGAVIEYEGVIHKLFYSKAYYGMVLRGEDPYQEIIIHSIVNTFAERENNPHFVKLLGVSGCIQDEEIMGNDYMRLFMHMKKIAGTFLSIYNTLSYDEAHSLFFQYLRGCQFLQNHGIVHLDIHAQNLGYDHSGAIEYIDYEDGWSVPTYGRFAKILDFGSSDRYIKPEYRTYFLDVREYDEFNTANDPIAVIYVFARAFESGRIKEVIDRAKAFCEAEFGMAFDDMVRDRGNQSLAKVSTKDITFVGRLCESVFPEYRV